MKPFRLDARFSMSLLVTLLSMCFATLSCKTSRSGNEIKEISSIDMRTVDGVRMCNIHCAYGCVNSETKQDKVVERSCEEIWGRDPEAVFCKKNETGKICGQPEPGSSGETGGNQTNIQPVCTKPVPENIKHISVVLESGLKNEHYCDAFAPTFSKYLDQNPKYAAILNKGGAAEKPVSITLINNVSVDYNPDPAINVLHKISIHWNFPQVEASLTEILLTKIRSAPTSCGPLSDWQWCDESTQSRIVWHLFAKTVGSSINVCKIDDGWQIPTSDDLKNASQRLVSPDLNFKFSSLLAGQAVWTAETDKQDDTNGRSGYPHCSYNSTSIRYRRTFNFSNGGIEARIVYSSGYYQYYQPGRGSMSCETKTSENAYADQKLYVLCFKKIR